MKGRRVIFVCNALEDLTRIEREIYSDSPAASRKIFQMASALRGVGERVIILSMGRGCPNGIGRFYKSKISRVDGIPIIYAPFSQTPIISQLLSFISLPYLLYRMKYFKGKTSVVFYNRTTAYISSLLTCPLFGYTRILDLEDGELIVNNLALYQIFLKIKRWLYDKLCNGGTILACSALADIKTNRIGLCYYGAVSHFQTEISWKFKKHFKFLMCGTVSYDTGAKTLADAIYSLRNNPEPWVEKLEFIITGKGDCIHYFEELAKIEKSPYVKVKGRLTDSDYSDVVQSCDVGLALKPNTGMLANTTFPSKVIELASSGLLVLTTNISDVKFVLGDGALYLENDRVESLLERIHWISNNPHSAEVMVKAAVESVKIHCGLRSAGIKLSKYIFRNES